MDRQTFGDRFRAAAIAARDFARTYVEENLPDQMLFRLQLSTYDGQPPLRPDEKAFPQDSSPQAKRAFGECTEEVVISTLFREDTFPEWVNLRVIDETGRATVVEVDACPRFTANEARLFHEAKWPPFEVHGPVLPDGYQPGPRFSIHHLSEYWGVGEVQRLRGHEDKVTFLRLVGDEFNDQAITALPQLPAIDGLDFQDSPMDGSGLAALERFLNLRVLRVALRREGRFSVSRLPTLTQLDMMDLQGLPSVNWGFEGLAEKAPNLTWLSMQSTGALVAHGHCPNAITTLTMNGSRISGTLLLPKKLDDLGLHLREASPNDIEQVLAPVEALTSLDLHDTPVDEDLVLHLASRFGPKRLILTNTGLDEQAMRRIARAHPDIGLLPKLHLAK